MTDDGVQVTANRGDVVQHVRMCGSTDRNSNNEIGCCILSVDRHPTIHQAQNDQQKRQHAAHIRVGYHGQHNCQYKAQTNDDS